MIALVSSQPFQEPVPVDIGLDSLGSDVLLREGHPGEQGIECHEASGDLIRRADGPTGSGRGSDRAGRKPSASNSAKTFALNASAVTLVPPRLPPNLDEASGMPRTIESFLEPELISHARGDRWKPGS
jgi:hypothetical protein